MTVISDEVYEHLTLGDAHYISIATLPGMFERTVTVSSVGKSFSATGWKIGWVYGRPELVEGILRAHQFITFSIHHPSQQAVAYALNLPDSYFTDFVQPMKPSASSSCLPWKVVVSTILRPREPIS